MSELLSSERDHGFRVPSPAVIYEGAIVHGKWLLGQYDIRIMHVYCESLSRK